jgi:hypothetical protein
MATVRASASDDFRRRLAVLLAVDERSDRARQPVSLAGRFAPEPPPPQSLPPTPPRQTKAQFFYLADREVAKQAAEPEDIHATWTRERLIDMNARFVARVERAFRTGSESRAAAAANERGPTR